MKPSISKYFAQIGARGGAAGKGTELRRKLASDAAKARWAKRKMEQQQPSTEPAEASATKNPLEC